MCSVETERLVSKLFMTLAEGERSIEISRQVLSDLIEFDPYKIFKTLDIEGKNKIDSSNILAYLRNKGIYASEQEASLLILFYDQDFDGVLSYPEFIHLINSDKNVQKMSYNSKNEKLPYNIDYSLGKLLEKEIELSRKILFLLQDIKSRYDFNVHNIYHSVKNYDSITPDGVRKFLDKNEVSYLNSDIKSIIRRLDLNKDGRIELFEIHALFGFPNCVYCCPYSSCSICGVCYCDSCYSESPCYFHGIIHNNKDDNSNKNNSNKNQVNENNQNYENIIYKTEQNSNNSLNKNNNFDNNYSMPNINKNMNLTQPNSKIDKFQTSIPKVNTDTNVLNNQEKEDYEEKLSKTLSIRKSPGRKYGPIEIDLSNSRAINTVCCPCRQVQNVQDYPINNNIEELNNFELKQFNDFLRLLMKTERTIEQIKIDLSLNQDFNCEDSFRIFEKNNRGYLTRDDLKYGLYLLDIIVDDFTINLLFKRFDLKKYNEINYADFFDMLIPFEKKYRTDIEKRQPKIFDFRPKNEIFNNNTIKCLKNTLILIIKCEKEINEIRKGFSILMRKLKNIFKLFDKNENGYFIFDEYIDYLKKYNLTEDSLNVDLLFIRLDKNRNGKIDFVELADEIEALY